MRPRVHRWGSRIALEALVRRRLPPPRYRAKGGAAADATALTALRQRRMLPAGSSQFPALLHHAFISEIYYTAVQMTGVKQAASAALKAQTCDLSRLHGHNGLLPSLTPAQATWPARPQ